MELAVATAPRRDSKTWKQGTVTWEGVVSWAAAPSDAKECGNYVLGTLEGNQRSKHTIRSRSALTLDADYADASFPDLVEMALGSRALVHSTWRSTPEEPRFRLIVPLSRAVTPQEYGHAARVLMGRLGRDQFDPGSDEPERYMFKPATPDPTTYVTREIPGELLDVDELLRTPDPQPAPDPTHRTRKQNPEQLAGTVGAFNRAYTHQEAIDAFGIPYIQTGEDRWRFGPARGASGVSLIPGTDGGWFSFSHHTGDPAYGQACSAFDLVRLHRFGELDEGVEPGTPVNRLPSHQAMLELATEDAKVAEELIGADFDGPLTDHAWRLDLRRNARSGKLVDSVDNWDLIRANDPVFGALFFNEFTFSVETEVAPPWRPMENGGEVFSEVDRMQLGDHLEREYGIHPSRQRIDTMVDGAAQQRFRNPVREYLLKLEWDGVPRVETCLPGVRVTDQTRMIARKCMAAAVARALEPGIKWDHTLILYGSEGLGKTHWIETMAGKYSSSLGDIRNKDTLLTLQASWIVVSDEGHSLRKAEADAQKEFLTRSADRVRRPYDRHPILHPRHCVIWGTTNDETFLRKQEGNRRFLVVHCEEKATPPTPEERDQIWAEAVHIYRSREPLWLNEEESMLSKAAREVYEEEDALSGLVEEFLETPVAEDWDSMAVEERLDWMRSRDSGLEVGTRTLTEVCTSQLWAECLRNEIGRHQRTDLLPLAKAMNAMPGWEPVPGRVRHPNYGPQKTWRRTDTEDWKDLI